MVISRSWRTSGRVPVALDRGLGQALPDIEPGHPAGYFHDPVAHGRHALAQFEEQIVFEGLAFFAGGQQLFLKLLVGRGDVAFAIGQGLAALEMGRG